MKQIKGNKNNKNIVTNLRKAIKLKQTEET